MKIPDTETSSLVPPYSGGGARYFLTQRWAILDGKVGSFKAEKTVGDVWLALELIKKLGLAELLESLMSEQHPPKISWATLSHVLIISRFGEPSSELQIAEQFYRNSALSDLVGIPEEDIYDNRLYRTLDKLVGHKDDLQKHLGVLPVVVVHPAHSAADHPLQSWFLDRHSGMEILICYFENTDPALPAKQVSPLVVFGPPSLIAPPAVSRRSFLNYC